MPRTSRACGPSPSADGDDNVLVDFGLEELRNGTEFPPGHLAEHQVTAEPVRVFYRDEGGTLQAIWVDDAGS